MKFNLHSGLEGKHSFLSASNYHWVNYDEDKIQRTFMTQLASVRGTREHAFAAEAIRLGRKLQETSQTLNLYVNECIGFRMTPEQPLFYSENAFGTPDAISFRQNVLRISDLKTGETPVKFTQLEVYAAYFCLEYQIKPFEIDLIEMRIYQNDEVAFLAANPIEIMVIMDKIVTFDKYIRRLREEAEL